MVFVLFLLVGIAVLDDYGVSWDEEKERRITEKNINYILEGNSEALPKIPNILYGIAFQLPLLWAERLLGLEDTRTIYLSRHLLTHLFFLLGAVCCYLLAVRLFNNRLLALAAMLLFLLHPRLYAHSFFNSKDIPFFSMFMISLLLIHRAFALNTVRAFLLCGAAVAVLINLRVMGVMLFVAVVMMRGLDVWHAKGRPERIRVLKTLGGFILSSVLTLYVIWPYLWEDPVGRFTEIISVFSKFSDFPSKKIELFQGQFIDGTNPPKDYLSTWFLITTPWVALLLGFIGIVAVGYRGLTRPRKIVRNTPVRFQWLLLACFVLPVLAVTLLGSTFYNGWRHMYFIYAPFCLLAAFGLYQLVSFCRQKSWRAAVYTLTGVGLGIVVMEMMQIHPHQNVYFNALVDRHTPEYLRTQYEMDYWGTSYREGLEYLLARYPNSSIRVYGKYGHVKRNRMILPATERQRVKDTTRADFYLTNYREYIWKGKKPDIFNSIYTRKVYNSTLFTVQSMNLALLDESSQAFYRDVHHKAKADVPVTRSVFDVYRYKDKLVYLRESCNPEDLRERFFVHVLPVNETDLPSWRKPYGFDNLDFDFYMYGVGFDGKCMAILPLPEYDINAIRTGQFTNEGNIWQAELSFGK